METTTIGLIAVLMTVLSNLAIEWFRNRKTKSFSDKEKAEAENISASTLDQLRKSFSGLFNDYNLLFDKLTETKNEVLFLKEKQLKIEQENKSLLERVRLLEANNLKLEKDYKTLVKENEDLKKEILRLKLILKENNIIANIK